MLLTPLYVRGEAQAVYPVLPTATGKLFVIPSNLTLTSVFSLAQKI
jgi:hypothetical protein